jgi:hypothetical protein
MKVRLAAAGVSILLCVASSSAFADASQLTAADFLEMNETYRAALIHGLITSASVLGLPEIYQRFYDDGVRCRLTRGRQETVYQLSADFGRYLNAHPEDTKGPFPMVFLLFMADCPKN